MLKVGDPAPDFILPSHNGQKFQLSEYRGKKNVFLAFYPADWTPVCSGQMPEYQTNLMRFEDLDTQVVGISVDSVPSHVAWADSFGGIDYPLLSDFYPHGEVAERYGVLTPDGYTERAVFIVDKEGIVRYIDHHDFTEPPDINEIFAQLRKLKEAEKVK
jgi:peroxiredoxin